MINECNQSVEMGFIPPLRWLFFPDEDAGICDFIKQIETVYKGLGIPVLYGALSILANKSVLFIAGRGSGKTRVIKSIPDIPQHEISNWDTFTLGELSNYCEKFEEEPVVGVKGKHFVFKVEEFSTLSEYHREIFLTVCSKLSSDGNYTHVTDITPHLHIENCKLTMLLAIQPMLYSLLCHRHNQWENISSDRFSKFLLLNPLREETNDTSILPTLPRKIPNTAKPSGNIDLSKLIQLYGGQISEGRAFLYARDYAIAMARLQGKGEVEQEDVDLFYRLFNPYLETFSRLQQRADLESAITVSSGHMELLTEIGKHFEGVTKQQLSNSLMVTPRHIERCADFLLEKEVIREEEEGTYHLSTILEQFFNWYRERFSV